MSQEHDNNVNSQPSVKSRETAATIALAKQKKLEKEKADFNSSLKALHALKSAIEEDPDLLDTLKESIESNQKIVDAYYAKYPSEKPVEKASESVANTTASVTTDTIITTEPPVMTATIVSPSSGGTNTASPVVVGTPEDQTSNSPVLVTPISTDATQQVINEVSQVETIVTTPDTTTIVPTSDATPQVTNEVSQVETIVTTTDTTTIVPTSDTTQQVTNEESKVEPVVTTSDTTTIVQTSDATPSVYKVDVCVKTLLDLGYHIHQPGDDKFVSHKEFSSAAEQFRNAMHRQVDTFVDGLYKLTGIKLPSADESPVPVIGSDTIHHDS